MLMKEDKANFLQKTMTKPFDQLGLAEDKRHQSFGIALYPQCSVL